MLSREIGYCRDSTQKKTDLHARSSNPRDEYFANLHPVDGAKALCGKRKPNDRSNDRVRGGNWQGHVVGRSEYEGRRHERCQHAVHENVGLVFVERGVDNLSLDGRGHRSTEQHGTEEFADRCDDDGLLESDRLGRDARGKRWGLRQIRPSE